MILISPAKKLDLQAKPTTEKYTLPDLTDYSKILISQLRKYSIEDLTKLLNISYGLAEKNKNYFLNWSLPFNQENAKQAIYTFNGDVYAGINAKSLDNDEIEFLQNNLRILSGLYGLLRPLDLIQPYRLPMGTKLTNPNGKNLYEFWGDIITQTLNHHLTQTGNNIVLNLASVEYFKAVKPEKVNAKIINFTFKENKNGQYRVISFYAKRARGLMTRFIAQNKITNYEDLKAFDMEGYRYEPNESNKDKLVFVR